MSNKKLRILFIRPNLGYGGADRVTLNILQDFDRARFQCDLALMQKKGELLPFLPKDVQLFEAKAFNIILLFWSLIPIINKGKYDVLYSTSGGTNVPLVIASWLSSSKAKIVLSERSALFAPGKSKWKQLIQFLLKKITYKKADFVTCVSQGLMIQMKQHMGVVDQKLKLVFNPIINDDLLKGKNEALKNEAFVSGKPIILAVGRLIPLKDYPTLIEAFQKVRKNINCILYILGKGQLEDSLKEKVVTLGLEKEVIFGGFDSNPFKYMKNASVFVLSSRHEGMPGVLIQAMACGVPVIATDCPTGPSELISDGENGFLVPIGNVNQIALRMEQLLVQPDLAVKLIANAQKSITKFHQKAAIESYFEFLERVETIKN